GSKQRTCVAAHFLVEAATQELPDWQTERLAFDIPECHVDAAHRMQAHSPPASVNIAAIHLVPDLLGLEWIFPNDETRQSGGSGVGKRAFNDPLGAHWVGIHFANARNASVRFDPDDQRILTTL